MFTVARSPLFPQVGYQGDGARQRLPDDAVTPGIQNPETTYEAFATASWEIDLWGRIRRQTEAARAELLASQEARRGVLLSLVSSVATTYLNLRALDEQLTIAQNTRDAYVASLHLFELQFKYGVVSDMTVAQARSQYESALVSIAQIEQQIVAGENALSILLGRNPGTVARGKADRRREGSFRTGRPSVRTAHAATRHRAGRAEPDRRERADRRRQSAVLPDDLANGPVRWRQHRSFRPVRWRFERRGTTPARSPARSSRAAAFQGRWRKRARRRRRRSTTTRNDSARVRRRRQRAVGAAETRPINSPPRSGWSNRCASYARLALLQYNGGYTSYLTVLDADQQLFPAELNLAQTRAALLNSVTDIYKATGGGWIHEADSFAPQPTEGGWLSPSVANEAATPR